MGRPTVKVCEGPPEEREYHTARRALKPGPSTESNFDDSAYRNKLLSTQAIRQKSQLLFPPSLVLGQVSTKRGAQPRKNKNIPTTEH